MSIEMTRPAEAGKRDVLHYDFCPWANNYVYWLKTPIGWLFTAAATAAMLGIYVAPQAIAVTAAVVALILLGMLWPAIAMKGIRGQLTWQRRRSIEGELIETVLEVTNRWPWPVWGLAIESDDEVVNDGSGISKSVALACLRPLSTTQFVWDSRPTQRGLYPEKASYFATGFPFGIWTARAKLVVPQSLLVWPEAIDLHDMPNLSGDRRSIVGAWIDKAGHEGDVIGVRPFRDGDSLRNVHWAQSAKSDNLIVCERQSVARRSIHLTIDQLPTTRQTTNEWLVRIAASIAKTFLAHHWSVQLEIDGKTVQSEPGESGLRKLMDLLVTFDRHSSQQYTSESQAHLACMDHGVVHEPLHELAHAHHLADSKSRVSWSRSSQRSNLRTNRKHLKSEALQIIVTSSDRVETMKQSGCQFCSSLGWVLVDDSASKFDSMTSEITPWMRIELPEVAFDSAQKIDSSLVWKQVQSQWDHMCQANNSMVSV